jgi:hypothetical protein
MALSNSNRLLKTESRSAVRPRPSAPGSYVLATGEAAAYRLRILHALYGPGSRRVLLEAGLRRGMRVADLGCGVCSSGRGLGARCGWCCFLMVILRKG